MGASKALGCTVGAKVTVKVSPRSERLGAEVTLMRLVALVLEDVAAHGRASGERHRAQVAHERFFARVHPDVLHQRRPLPQYFPTHIALE